MVTTFNQSDLVSFGKYLLSDERRKRYENHPGFPDGKDLESRLSEISHADIENWKDSQSKIKKVRAKFNCNFINRGEDTSEIQMLAVINGSPENDSFSKYTPAGAFSIHISNEAPALELFKTGSDYYLDITRAPKE